MSATPNTDRRGVSHQTSPTDPAGESVLELILIRVRLRLRRRASWLSHLWGGTIPAATGSFENTLNASLDDRDTPEGEATWFESCEELRATNAAIDSVEQALAGRAGSGLRQLAEIFGLTLPELDLLQMCLAFAVDSSLSAAFGYVQQSGRSYPTEALGARLFGHGRRSMWSPGCSLAVWKLVTAEQAPPGEALPLSADKVVLDWLQDDLRMDARLVGLVRRVESRTPLDSWPVTAVAKRIQQEIERGAAVRTLVTGPSSSGRRTFAAAVAARFGIRALSIDTSPIADSDWPDIYIHAQRFAYLGGAALVWHGTGLHRICPNTVAPVAIQFLACDADLVVPACEQVIDNRIHLPTPTVSERRHLWHAYLPETQAWPSAEFETVVMRYRLSAGDIAGVARRAPGTAREAAEFCREVTRHHLGELAKPLECHFGWDDLVVTDKLRESLEDFAFEARDRTAFWELSHVRRLFPRGTGLVALFNGPPGTGKTMAAQVIAADLQLDVVRVDLAAVVSKYIGETAKHLSRIFARAANMNAVLLFDEADALFSKRTDVKDSHDRYANTDTSYLLQLLEEHDGIVILATNKKQNIDAAFIRRIRYVFDFPRPEAAERRQIWSKLIGDLAGGDALRRLDYAIERLAANVESSGAQIKNAVLAGMFACRRNSESLGMAHLLRGVERELSKEGRALGAHERERLTQDV
jgi:ATPase family associated with various cellular activities (AAA)/Winged helix domain, variant